MDANLQILRSLAFRESVGQAWSRPMDIGAHDGSSHSSRLKRLSMKGLVQRERRNSICNLFLNSARGSYVYGITEAGQRMLAEAIKNKTEQEQA